MPNQKLTATLLLFQPDLRRGRCSAMKSSHCFNMDLVSFFYFENIAGRDTIGDEKSRHLTPCVCSRASIYYEKPVIARELIDNAKDFDRRKTPDVIKGV